MILPHEYCQLEKKNVLVLAGPTASGKSSLALRLAEKYSLGPIINGDSIQRYKHLPLLAACPSEEDYISHDHRGYEQYSPFEGPRQQGALWVQETEKILENSLKEGKIPLVVGGTGLYLQKLCFDDFCFVPSIDPQQKQYLEQEFKTFSPEDQRQKVMFFDPLLAQRFQDPQRLQRAYVVYYGTGKSLSFWQQKAKEEKSLKTFSYRPLVLWPSLDKLHQRAQKRWSIMKNRGILEEVRHFMTLGLGLLLAQRNKNNDFKKQCPTSIHTLLLEFPAHDDHWATLESFYDFFSQNRSCENFSWEKKQWTILRFVLSKNPLRFTLGFEETLGYLLGFLSSKEWEESYLQKTHHYIKKQRTWLRSQWNPYISLGLTEECLFC